MSKPYWTERAGNAMCTPLERLAEPKTALSLLLVTFGCAMRYPKQFSSFANQRRWAIGGAAFSPFASYVLGNGLKKCTPPTPPSDESEGTVAAQIVHLLFPPTDGGDWHLNFNLVEKCDIEDINAALSQLLKDQNCPFNQLREINLSVGKLQPKTLYLLGSLLEKIPAEQKITITLKNQEFPFLQDWEGILRASCIEKVDLSGTNITEGMDLFTKCLSNVAISHLSLRNAQFDGATLGENICRTEPLYIDIRGAEQKGLVAAVHKRSKNSLIDQAPYIDEKIVFTVDEVPSSVQDLETPIGEVGKQVFVQWTDDSKFPR